LSWFPILVSCRSISSSESKASSFSWNCRRWFDELFSKFQWFEINLLSLYRFASFSRLFHLESSFSYRLPDNHLAFAHNFTISLLPPSESTSNPQSSLIFDWISSSRQSTLRTRHSPFWFVNSHKVWRI
jgi:hypothetical protein